MGRKSADSTAQTKVKAKPSGSGSSSGTPQPAKASISTSDKTPKSPSTAANPRGNVTSKPVKMKQKVAPKPVEADSEESEQEWVGFGGMDGESGEEDEESGDGEEGGHSSEEEPLHGLSSDDQDSSDEEVELPGIHISKLPTIARDDKIVKQKLEKAKRQPVRTTFTRDSVFCGLNFVQTEDRGVVFLGRIPHGFHEEQMKSYFAQFGGVTRLRLSRNKKVHQSPTRNSHPTPC